MRSIRTVGGVLVFAGSTLLAQTGAPAQPGTTPGVSTLTPGVGNQIWSGVLLDANCPAITSSRTQSSFGIAGDPGEAQYRAGTQGGAAGGGGSPASTIGGAGTSGAGMTARTGTSAATGGTAGTGTTTASGRAGANSGDRARSSGTESASGVGTTGGTRPQSSNTANADLAGQTGSSRAASTTGMSASGTAGAPLSGTAPGSGTDAASSRSRSLMGGAAGSSGSPDYTVCRVTGATTSFALNSGGRVVMFDSSSNERIRQQLQTSWFTHPASTSRDLNVSIAGAMQGDNLSLSTLTIQ